MQTNRVVPLHGKAVYYKTDGTGRDTYIKIFNGGLLSKDRIHHLNQIKPEKQRNFSFSKNTYGKHPHSYQKGGSNKFVHYISDGSGRDYYVASTQGGNSTQHRWRDQVQFKFRSTLRAGQQIVDKNPQQDVFMKSQSKFTATQSRFNRTMSSIQSTQINRLSQPKKIPVPPALEAYMHPRFDATRQFKKLQYGKNH